MSFVFSKSDSPVKSCDFPLQIVSLCPMPNPPQSHHFCALPTVSPSNRQRRDASQTSRSGKISLSLSTALITGLCLLCSLSGFVLRNSTNFRFPHDVQRSSPRSGNPGRVRSHSVALLAHHPRAQLDRPHQLPVGRAISTTLWFSACSC